eukprot:symbB.v1.2.000915.t1/scaffold27.1/size414596/23
MDSRNATSMASIVTCAVMIARQEPRSPAHLWEVDWQALGKELEPPQVFVQKLKDTALLMASGKKLESFSKALWREMNRLPHLWLVESNTLQPQELGRQSPELAGLEQLRLCVKAFAEIAVPHCQQDSSIPVICFHGVLTFPMSSNPPISARLALEGQLVQETVLAQELRLAEERQAVQLQELQAFDVPDDDLEAVQQRIQQLEVTYAALSGGEPEADGVRELKAGGQLR